MSAAEKMTKAERLSVAGAVAPTLRSQSERTRTRVVKVYDQATGEVVRHATLADVQRGILETAKIELDVADGKKKTKDVCRSCGGLMFMPKRGKPRLRCDACKFPPCRGCGVRPKQRSRGARAEHGYCRACACSRGHLRTPENLIPHGGVLRCRTCFQVSQARARATARARAMVGAP